MTEWGIPVTLAGFLALGTALRPKVLVVSSSPAIGAWSAIATTVVHNLVDFNSEVPAIGIAVAVCAAMVVAGRGNARRGWIHSWGAHPRIVATMVGAVTLVSIAVVLSAWPHEIREDRAELYGEISSPTLPTEFFAHERQVLLRHPSEAYVPFIASVAASRKGVSVIPWIERTLELAPIYAPAHFVLAQQLERRSPSQARLEYRLAIAQEERDSVAEEILTRAAPLVTSFDDALELVPTNRYRLPALLSLAQKLGNRLPSTRERLDEMALSIDPNATGALERVIVDVTTDLGSGSAAPWCQAKAACAKLAMDAITRVIALRPGLCEPYVERARLELVADDAVTALHDLETQAAVAVDPIVCWKALGELAASTKNDRFVTAAEEAMTRGGCGADAECADHFAWAASMEERRGNYRRAIGFYIRAQEKAPERVDILEHTAQLASAMELHAEALEAYRKLSRLSPEAEKWRQLAEREKTVMVRESIPVKPVERSP
jgi:tetratricopeptide (TPR) repeat protein